MPHVDEIITVGVNPSYSKTHYEAGLLELVDLKYGGGIGVVIVSIEERDKAGNWTSRWQSPSTNTAASYAPSKPTTLPDGTAGEGESLTPLRSPYGWRVKVAGAATGSVTAQVSLDGPQQE